MMTKNKVLWILLFISIPLNIAVIGAFIFFTFFAPHGHGGKEMPRDKTRWAERRLNSENRDKLHTLMSAFKEENKSKQDTIYALEKSIITIMQSEKPDTIKVKKTIERIAVLKGQVNYAATKKFLQAKTFLSKKEQRFFFKMLLDTRLERFKKRRFTRGNRHKRPSY